MEGNAISFDKYRLEAEGARMLTKKDAANIQMWLNQALIAIRPVRLVGYGDASRLTYTDGRVYVIQKSPMQLMRLASNEFGVYDKWLRGKYNHLIAKSQNFPYVFSSVALIFVNVKCRCNTDKNERAVGYVNLEYLSTIKPAPNGQACFIATDSIAEVVPMSVQSLIARRTDAYAFYAQLQKQRCVN